VPSQEATGETVRFPLNVALGAVAIWLLIAGHSVRAPYDWAMITAGALIVGFLALTK
jgi:hypothetical protein